MTPPPFGKIPNGSRFFSGDGFPNPRLSQSTVVPGGASEPWGVGLVGRGGAGGWRVRWWGSFRWADMDKGFQRVTAGELLIRFKLL